ncbi:MAG: hypothetical protein EBR41_05025, partial [Crocinitomicaceae bacterium]|nr:hypothetical protein [Crocinitomicaceae bacterium]
MKHYFLIPLLFFFGSVHSQINEDFTDGDFTNSPIWTGTNLDYIVNNGNQLQVSNTLGDTSYLATPHG